MGQQKVSALSCCLDGLVCLRSPSNTDFALLVLTFLIYIFFSYKFLDEEKFLTVMNDGSLQGSNVVSL